MYTNLTTQSNILLFQYTCSKSAFKEDLKAKLQNIEKTYLNFETTFKSVLAKHAQEKKDFASRGKWRVQEQ